MMKKAMSCTLAATLAISPAKGFATEVSTDENTSLPEVSQPTSITGKLEVDINFATPIINNSQNDMKLVLRGEQTQEEVSLATNSGTTKSGKIYTIERLNSSKNPIKEGEMVSFIRVIFENLELGNYSFDLSASGYKTATVDNIDITNYSKRVKVGTRKNQVVKSYGETEDQNEYEEYPALFSAGDVRQDNVINMEDYNILLENINTNNDSYDINKDGKTDIADLSYVKESIGSEKNIPTDRNYIENTDAIINPDNVGMTVNEETTVNGLTGEEAKNELKKLLVSGDSSVAIGNKDVAPSEENPIKIGMDLSSISSFRTSGAVEMEQVVIKAPTSTSEDAGMPETGFIEYKVDGSDEVQKVPFNGGNVKKSRSGSDDLVIDLGSQIAVKEISINVTGNRGNKNISEIAQIEFLNNVYKEIPKPVISIPTIKTLETSTNLHDERITISWNPQPNVTSYEVKYFKIDDKGDRVGPEKKLQTNKTNLNILDKAIKPYDKFRVSIQSLNGEWSSGYAEDLANKSEEEGGLSEEKKKELMPYTLDGTADNVDENFNMKEDYYGLNGKQPNMGSVSDIQVIPINAPDVPINLNVQEGYRSLKISWENHIQARDFDIFYRKLGDKDTKWIKANDPRVTLGEDEVDNTAKNLDKSKLHRSHNYTLNGLDDEATYEVRVTATNHLGTSKMSQIYLGTTTSITPPKMPNYKLINTPKANVGDGEIGTENIKSVVNHSDAQVNNEFAVVDNDYSSIYIINDWDAGGHYDNFRGPIVEFNKEYTIDRISLAVSEEQGKNIIPEKVRLRTFEDPNNPKVHNTRVISTTASNGKKYATIKLNEPITTNKIQVNPSIPSYGSRVVNIAELKFHEADNIEQDVKNLYKDEFRVELREGVTQEEIDNIRKRANTMDSVSKEYNPDRTNILKDLDVAESLLNGANLSNEITTLDPTIKSNSGSSALGMANDWQSLGAVARPGKDGDQSKKIVVYVGSDDPGAKVELAFLQHFGQPSKYMTKSKALGSGRHEITIPEIFNNDVEKGGQVMARMASGKSDATIKVRLAGVDEIPHLNVNNIINDKDKEDEVKDKIRTYIKELKKYVSDLPNMYKKSVTAEDRKNNIYTYDAQTSTLNATDIEGDRFTLTMPASQILKGIESGLKGNENDEVERVYNALLAWEQQIQLGYAKKGVYESVENAPSKEEYEKHKAPATRMNIKYQRMIMGAAGYASSHHVGVGYGGVPVYMQGVPFKFDENQNLINKDEAHLYDDLINHEIGHVLDIRNRTYDETSNNLMVALSNSMLNQDPTSKLGKDTYKKMYEKATSNTLGLSTDRNVVLGMLWQPYLAYENNDTYKMLLNDNDKDSSNDSYFAKLNRAYREMTDNEKANADRDQLLIRMTSKVANKDLSKFYLAYGIVPNETTLQYVSKFDKETRPIQYINDEARRQRLAKNADMSSDTKLVASFEKDNKGKQIEDKSYVNQDTVPIKLSVNKDSDKILGYEIYRNGKPCGFVERNKNGETIFNDVVDNSNNRVFTYEAIAYDYNLKATEKANLGTVKVRHDGSVNKEKLNITSNTIDINDSNYDEHANNPNPSLAKVIDNNDLTVYEGKKHDTNEDPYVVIDANEVRPLAGIKYTAPTTTSKFFKINKTSKTAIQNYKLEVSNDGKTWTTVKNGSFKLDPNNPTETIYFDKEGVEGGNQLNVYNTRFVKLTALGATNISIAELDLISPPGDNIEIGVSDDNINYKNGLGILSEEFVYQVDNPDTSENEKKSIPKGSVIITGEYRGNPAFNVPLVLNENEEHIADKYKGLLMADVPDNGNLEEIAEGSWVYWVEPDYIGQFMENKQIFAELYRTDTADAKDDGQRLVSDTFKIDVPNELPKISLSGGQGKNRSAVKYTEIKTKTLS
ncbi:M60 family metallopeptidase [Romboutsia sp. 1001713B170131_170501_G6]|uniref:M60 family metallopeptidase n=1 Tax=Romboutsia sp. 1001713B170131_170501_G6 TaxID=2787108 RepID=UPI0018AACD5D|nr:M60 family metallopeptidase [Romboutsia sp. 1001713B170131_170501_G6]